MVRGKKTAWILGPWPRTLGPLWSSTNDIIMTLWCLLELVELVLVKKCGSHLNAEGFCIWHNQRWNKSQPSGYLKNRVIFFISTSSNNVNSRLLFYFSNVLLGSFVQKYSISLQWLDLNEICGGIIRPPCRRILWRLADIVNYFRTVNSCIINLSV